MSKKNWITLYYCPKCKELLFRWNDIGFETVVQDRFLTESGEDDYGECETIDSAFDSRECTNGHYGLIEITITKESFKKIFSYDKNTFPITIPEEYYGDDINDEDFNNLLFESGITNLEGEK